MDSTGKRTLDIQNFANAIYEFRIQVEDWEIEALFDFFDSGMNGYINFDEFILGVRGPMNEFRNKLIMRAFDTNDEGTSGFIPLHQLRALYKARNIPEVRSGSISAVEATEEFLEGVDFYYALKGFKDTKITREEFGEFYSFVSPYFATDDEFEEYVVAAWGLGVDNQSSRSLISNRSQRSRISQRSHKIHLGRPDDPSRSGLSYRSNRSRPMSRHDSQFLEEGGNSQRSGRNNNYRYSEEKQAPLKGNFIKKAGGEQTEGDASGVHPLIAKMRAKLNRRGGRAYIGMLRQFMVRFYSQNSSFHHSSKKIKKIEHKVQNCYDTSEADANHRGLLSLVHSVGCSFKKCSCSPLWIDHGRRQ